jgi:protein gp37
MRLLGALNRPAPFHGFAENTPNGPRWTGKVALVPEALDWPLRRRKPLRIFVNSMSDLFHEALPVEALAQIFDVMASATLGCRPGHREHDEECWTGDQHTFLILTKRPERMRKLLSEELPWFIGERMPGDSALSMADWPLPNVWLGVSVEDQATADERIPLLLQTPAANRFISAEPLLGPIIFDSTHESDPCSSSFLSGIGGERVYDGEKVALDWVIAGGESGPGARPCDVGWIRSIVGQCRAAAVPCFVKQAGRWILGDDAGFPVNHWLLEDGRGYVPPLIGEPARQRPPTRVCSVPAVGFSLFDRKGGDPAEWPQDLRVRQVPA